MARGQASDEPTLTLASVLIHYGANRLPGGYGWQSMRCPFPEHDDSNASARVNLEAGGFICLACGISGDAIKIIKSREGTNYAGAVKFAGEVLGASVTEVSSSVHRSKKSPKFGRHKWKDLLD
jgi:DNA primase